MQIEKMDYGDVGREDSSVEGIYEEFIDYLLEQWRDYFGEMENVSVVPAELFGTGTIEELREILEYSMSIDSILDFIPGLRDVCNQKILEIYEKELDAFCQTFYREDNVPLTRGDLGEYESEFYSIFITIVSPKFVINVWDLWRK
jgi:hypothetical protein